MAMTDEELMLQMNILVSKISDNPNMPFKSNAVLNKGLNPEFFSGNYTKVVNALNQLAAEAKDVKINAIKVADKVNELLLDTSNIENQAIWEQLKVSMGQPTIIQGLLDLYEGKSANKLLGLEDLNVEDAAGKVLSIDKDEDGNLIFKAVSHVAEIPEVKATDIAYVNNFNDEITNVKNALDFVIDSIANGNIGDGGSGAPSIPSKVTWEMIENRPTVVADNMSLSSTHLELKDGDTVVSSVPLLSDGDVYVLLESIDEEEE